MMTIPRDASLSDSYVLFSRLISACTPRNIILFPSKLIRMRSCREFIFFDFFPKQNYVLFQKIKNINFYVQVYIAYSLSKGKKQQPLLRVCAPVHSLQSRIWCAIYWNLILTCIERLSVVLIIFQDFGQ